ncbi:hypothetical protein M0812_02908 [Anaeramoeba flamelloides]|uniref:Growth arrest-specific protein 8 domain-containing protein n=1 Tax=Anaeramoeba flamelloides TaxID=1746091 RepID=A0AAV7YRF6_9EUKA|nr:hypothetical protein M0812_02908 [Anaeramoeba flamelloides]
MQSRQEQILGNTLTNIKKEKLAQFEREKNKLLKIYQNTNKETKQSSNLQNIETSQQEKIEILKSQKTFYQDVENKYEKKKLRLKNKYNELFIKNQNLMKIDLKRKNENFNNELNDRYIEIKKKLKKQHEIELKILSIKFEQKIIKLNLLKNKDNNLKNGNNIEHLEKVNQLKINKTVEKLDKRYNKKCLALMNQSKIKKKSEFRLLAYAIMNNLENEMNKEMFKIDKMKTKILKKNQNENKYIELFEKN